MSVRKSTLDSKASRLFSESYICLSFIVSVWSTDDCSKRRNPTTDLKRRLHVCRAVRGLDSEAPTSTRRGRCRRPRGSNHAVPAFEGAGRPALATAERSGHTQGRRSRQKPRIGSRDLSIHCPCCRGTSIKPV